MDSETREKGADIGIGSEICIWHSEEECRNCALHKRLFCRPKIKYLFYFGTPLFIGIIPIILIVLFASIILAFKLIFFISWLIYAIFFFNVWETKILCNHCPYFANESQRVLHCVIDKGKYKAGKYDPGPLSLSEKIQLSIGGVLLMAFPIPFLVIWQLYVALLFYVIALILWIIVVQTKVCTDCINFACPLNRVPKEIMKQFMMKNPIIKKAWEKEGYSFE